MKDLHEAYLHNEKISEREIAAFRATIRNLSSKLDEYEIVIDNLNHIIRSGR